MSLYVREALRKMFTERIDSDIDNYNKLIHEAYEKGRITPSNEEEMAYAEQLFESEILGRTTLGNGQKVYQLTLFGKHVGELLKN